MTVMPALEAEAGAQGLTLKLPGVGNVAGKEHLALSTGSIPSTTVDL